MYVAETSGGMDMFTRVLLGLVVLLSSTGLAGDARAVGDTADARLANELKFRQDFGLNADPAAVRALMANPTAYDGSFGVALTPEELSDLLRRLVIQEQIGPVRAFAEALPSFAGIWFDQRRGGVLIVAFAGEADRHRPVVESLAPRGSTVEVMDVEYSWAQLSETLELVTRARVALKRDGLWIREMGIDPAPNRVELKLEEFSEDAARQLHARFGDTIAVEQSGHPTFTACTDRYNCIGPPVRAGIATQSNGCSLGFLVKVSGAPGTGWLTASHPPCGTVGQVVYHAGVAVGTIRASCWDPCLRADASLGGWLNTTYASYRVYRTPASNTQVNLVQSSIKGTTVCLNGRRQIGDTGWRCGVVDEINRVDYGNHFFLDQRYATFHAYSGDSGGAIHSGLINGRVNAYGIQSGCENLDGSLDGCEPGQADGRGIFSDINHVTADLTAQWGAAVSVCRVASPCP
jgi:hypothetical protein